MDNDDYTIGADAHSVEHRAVTPWSACFRGGSNPSCPTN